MSWTEALGANPVPWLLERENPPVRYWTLRELLEAARKIRAVPRVARCGLARALPQPAQPDPGEAVPPQRRVEQGARLPLDRMAADERAPQDLPDRMQRLLAAQQVERAERIGDQRTFAQPFAE